MWISRTQRLAEQQLMYALLNEKATLAERAAQLELRLAEAKERHALLYEDYSLATGLSKAKAAMQPKPPMDMHEMQAGKPTERFRTSSSPGQRLAELQMRLDAQNKSDEVDEVRAAIAQFERETDTAPVGAEVA